MLFFFFTNAAPAASAVQKQNKRSDKRKQKPNPHLDKKKQKNEKRIPASQRLTRVTGQKKKQANFVKVGRLGKEIPSPIEEKKWIQKEHQQEENKERKENDVVSDQGWYKIGVHPCFFFFFFSGGGGGGGTKYSCHVTVFFVPRGESGYWYLS